MNPDFLIPELGVLEKGNRLLRVSATLSGKKSLEENLPASARVNDSVCTAPSISPKQRGADGFYSFVLFRLIQTCSRSPVQLGGRAGTRRSSRVPTCPRRSEAHRSLFCREGEQGPERLRYVSRSHSPVSKASVSLSARSLVGSLGPWITAPVRFVMLIGASGPPSGQRIPKVGLSEAQWPPPPIGTITKAQSPHLGDPRSCAKRSQWPCYPTFQHSSCPSPPLTTTGRARAGGWG